MGKGELQANRSWVTSNSAKAVAEVSRMQWWRDVEAVPTLDRMAFREEVFKLGLKDDKEDGRS